MEDLGVLAIRNPNFFDFTIDRKNPDGSPRPKHGFHTLPDGTLTPLHVVMAMIVTTTARSMPRRSTPSH